MAIVVDFNLNGDASLGKTADGLINFAKTALPDLSGYIVLNSQFLV